MSEHFASGQGDDVEDSAIDVHEILPRGCFLDEVTNLVDDLAASLGVIDNVIERLPHLLQARRLRTEPAQRGLGVGKRCGDGLADFVGDRGGELAHRCDTVGVRQLHLPLAESLSSSLTFGDVAAQGNEQSRAVLAELSHANLDGDHRAVFSAMATLEPLRCPPP